MLRDFAAGVFRLEIQSVMLAFSALLCELLPISHSLWFNSLPLPPSLCELVYCIHVHSVWGGGDSSGPQTGKHLPQKSNVFS